MAKFLLSHEIKRKAEQQFIPVGRGGLEAVVAQWCNPLNLQPDHSDGVGSIPGRT